VEIRRGCAANNCGSWMPVDCLRVSYRQAKRLWQRIGGRAAGLKHRSAGRQLESSLRQKFREKVLGRVGKSPRSGGRALWETLARALEIRDGLKIHPERCGAGC